MLRLISILKGHTCYKQVGKGLVLRISQNKLGGPNGLRPRKLEYGVVGSMVECHLPSPPPTIHTFTSSASTQPVAQWTGNLPNFV
jgi:hypothetical protein